MKTFKRIMFWAGVLCACVAMFFLVTHQETSAAGLLATAALLGVIFGSPK